MNVSTSIGFTDPSAKLSYWIRLEQETPGDAATQEDAAEIIDEIFSLDPCVEPEEEPTEEAVDWNKKIEEALKKFEKFLEDTADAELCSDPDGCFVAKVRVYRSHDEIPYEILYKNCSLQGTVVGGVTKVSKAHKIEETSSLSLELPSKGVTTSWEGTLYTKDGVLDKKPERVVTPEGVSWGITLTGTLRVEYSQSYDLLLIKTNGEDAALTALYRLSVDEIDLEPPPEDDATEDLCKKIGEIDFTPPEGDCFVEYYHEYLCDCSGKKAKDGERTLKPTACPEGPGFSPGDIVREENSVSYVYCPEEEDDVHDPDYYLDKCCSPPPFALPRCKNRYSTFNGGVSSAQWERLRKMYDGKVKLVGVGPKESPCGRHVQKQDVNARNCCEGVPPMIADPSNPTEIIPNGIVRLIVFDGSPWTDEWVWTASGGLTFVNGLNRIVGSKEQRVFAPEVLCARSVVQVDDGCDRLTMELLSDAEPLTINDCDSLSVAPGGYIAIGAQGGVPPYHYSAEGLIHLYDGTFKAPEDGCGTVSVTVTDSCAEIVTCPVQITAGYWERVYDWDECSPRFSMSGGAKINSSCCIFQKNNSTVRLQSLVRFSNNESSCQNTCAYGNDLGSLAAACTDCHGGTYLGGGECLHFGGTDILQMGEALQWAYEWRC